MSNGKAVKDVMAGIFEYPHVPYWFSVSRSVRIVRVAFLGGKKYPEPMAVIGIAAAILWPLMGMPVTLTKRLLKWRTRNIYLCFPVSAF